MVHSIGKTIAELRKAKGWTQIELAEKLQVSDKAVSKWEQEGGIPSVEFFPALAEVFGVSIDYLMTGKKVDNVNLDDMDATKRLSYLIEKDDIDNFKKYKGLESVVSKKSAGASINTTLLKEIIEQKAYKIFNECCNFSIEIVTNKEVFAYYVYGVIDEFIKMSVDLDRADVLAAIGFNSFAIGNKKTNINTKNPFRNQQRYDISRAINNKDPFFIEEETVEYFFTNRNKAPNCFELLTTLNLTINMKPDSYRKFAYIFTYLQDYIVKYAIKFNAFDVVRKILKIYNEELSNPRLDTEGRSGCFLIYSKTYVSTQYGIEGRIFHFTKEVIEGLLNVNEIDLCKELIAFNKLALDKIVKMRSSYAKNTDDIYIMTDSEIERHLLLNSDISDKEKSKIKCVKDNILQVYEIKQLEDLKLAREIINSGYYNHFEIACECVKTDNYKALFELLIDLDCQDSANKLLTTPKVERVDVVYNLFRFFADKTNSIDKKIMDTYAQEARKMTFGLDTSVKSDELRKTWGLNVEKYCIEKMHDYILQEKELLYKHVKDKVDAKAKAEQDAKDRAKIIMDLDNAHFSELIGRNEIRLFVLDLCSLFDAILKFDYKIEGEDFFARMTKYFDNGPKTRYCDDGWGYSVVDSKYEQEEVIPWQVKRELFNRLRIQRNNIAHSESNKVQELTLQELADCLEFVFSLKKEIK